MIFSFLSNLVKLSVLFLRFFFTITGYLHDAQDGKAKKPSGHKAKQETKHLCPSPFQNAFHRETYKNDKIRTLG